MSKSAILKELVKRVKQGDSLAMDFASRMKRAKEQGFDTDTPYYRGTTQDEEIGGQFLTKDPTYASSYTLKMSNDGSLGYQKGGNVTKRFLKVDPIDIAEDPKLMEEFKTFVEYDSMTTWQKEDVLTKDGNLNFQAADKAREFLKRKGMPHNAIVIDEANGHMAVKVYDPSLQRSVNADFDPLEIGSNSLLAGIGGISATAGLSGASSLFTPKAQANTQKAEAELRRRGLSHLIPNTQKIEAATSPRLQAASNFLGNIEDPLGRPFESTSKILGNLAFSDEVSALDLGLGALEVLDPSNLPALGAGIVNQLGNYEN